jgi:hypothetical protein
MEVLGDADETANPHIEYITSYRAQHPVQARVYQLYHVQHMLIACQT